MGTAAEVESYVRGDAIPHAHDHAVLAQALKERFSEIGRGDPPVLKGLTSSGPSPRSLAYERAVAPIPFLWGSSARTVYGGVQLGLLGSFNLRINAEPVPMHLSAQRLIGFLALHDGSLLRQHVAGSMWAHVTERRASGSLRSTLSRLGQHAYPVVDATESHMRLFANVAVDVRASEALARRVLDDSQELSEADLDPSLLSADLLPDWTEDWVLVRREHHTQIRLAALDALCGRLREMGRFGQAVEAGLLAVSGEPLRESAQRTLIAAHLAEGNVTAAVGQYDSFSELLRDELDLEPSPEMQRLVEGLNR